MTCLNAQQRASLAGQDACIKVEYTRNVHTRYLAKPPEYTKDSMKNQTKKYMPNICDFNINIYILVNYIIIKH